MRNLAIIILALAIVAPTEAAEGRRTAFLGGLAAGIIGSVVVHEAMETKPAPRAEVVYVERPAQVVYVEAAPQVVYVERPGQVVYVEAAPQVVYVERSPRVVYVRAEHRNEFGWTAPIARPFPQGRGR